MKVLRVLAGTLGALVLIGAASQSAIALTGVPHLCLFSIPQGEWETINVGDQVAVLLNSNRTTGYSWSLSQDFYNQDIVTLVSHQYETQQSGMIGSGGAECFIFQGANAGGTAITLDYTRPWGTNVAPVRTATYYVQVNQP